MYPYQVRQDFQFLLGRDLAEELERDWRWATLMAAGLPRDSRTMARHDPASTLSHGDLMLTSIEWLLRSFLSGEKQDMMLPESIRIDLDSDTVNSSSGGKASEAELKARWRESLERAKSLKVEFKDD